MEQNNHLEIQMFGKFEMIYNGQVLNLGHSQTTKAMKLLQLLLFYGEDGIHRSQIIQYLFGVDAEGSIQNNLRVVVHNLRKILEMSGLPEGKYISVETGVYRFRTDFEVTVDVRKFEELIKNAKRSSDEEQCRLYKEACELYKGHFLPEIYGDDWVVMNSSRFQNMYSEATGFLAEKLKEKEEYEELRRLTNHASALCPLEEWQVYEIEAMVALGQVKEAYELYEKTTALYFEELMMPPSDRMIVCFHRMKEHLQMKTSGICEVQVELDEKEFLRGAFFCQYPSFVDSYRMMGRMMERSGQSAYLLMCTLNDEKGQLTDESEALKEVSEILRIAVQESLRRGDVFTRYNQKQYLVMLIGIREEECSIVTGRIDYNFRKKCSNRNIKLNFHISSVASGCEKFKKS